MNTPVIFLVFANPQDDHLPALTQERKGIEDALAHAVKDELIHLESESDANTKDIFKIFDRYRGQIKILHFGGHANNSALALQGQKAQARGLANLVGAENENGGVELVFLNACATAGQVKALLLAGTKNVIATTAKVKDAQACTFAQQFYESLAAGDTIKIAYKKAIALLQTNSENLPSYLRYLEEEQGLNHLNLLGEEDELPWGLYTLNNGGDFSLDLDDQSQHENKVYVDNRKANITQQMNGVDINSQGDVNINIGRG